MHSASSVLQVYRCRRTQAAVHHDLHLFPLRSFRPQSYRRDILPRDRACKQSPTACRLLCRSVCGHVGGVELLAPHERLDIRVHSDRCSTATFGIM